MREHFPLKPISGEAIPRALEKAERYRLLNQPWAAESICRDILEVDPTNQPALVLLLLSLTDQLTEGHAHGMRTVRDTVARLTDPYQRTYYAGIAAERRGYAILARGDPGSGGMAYDAFREAMALYEEAEAIRPPDDDDAILRWNTCARVLNGEGHAGHARVAPHVEVAYDPALEE